MKMSMRIKSVAMVLALVMVFGIVGNIPIVANAAAPSSYTDIAVGQTKNVTISTSGGAVYFRLIPQVTGTYVFSSSDTLDPYGYLLDSSGNTLASDDDGGAGNRDFRISYNCTAGNTYYLKAAMYNTNTGSYTVSLSGPASGSTTVTPGTSTYSLFNSGCTGDGHKYGSSSNPAAGTYTNSGYDIYASASNLPRTRLGLSFTVDAPVTELSYLTIKAFDVDESSGERDLIYLVDATTNTKTQLSGYLSGRDWEWNDTTFRIDPSLFTVGHEYYFELYESVSGWVVYVRTVDLQLGASDDLIGDFTAEISASGLVTANLTLTASTTATYSLEYAAVCGGNQYGSALGQSITATPSGATKTVTFQLESGAPEGNYQIEVTVRNASNQVVATYSTTTSGPNNSTVAYNANGGTNNLPVDQNVYHSGDRVAVLFDYIPTKTGYVFMGWARSSTATVAEFTQSGTNAFTIDGDDVTLYAVWQQESVGTTTGTHTYNLFNSGATTTAGREYSDSEGVDANPDSHSFTNNGYDIYGCSSSYSDLTIGMGLSFTITQEVVGRARLTIYAYDIDEERDQIDDVYLVNAATGARTKVGTLYGRNETWSTTVIEIDSSCFVVGQTYYFENDVCLNGWWTWIRRVSLEVTTGEPTAPPVDYNIDVSINASGLVSTELYLKSAEDTAYTVEYAAVIGGQQKGGKEVTGVAVTTTGTTILDSFALEAGAPEGTYEITVIIKDAAGNTIMTIPTTAGYAKSAVAYDPNGGSINCPTDRNAYNSGDTVTVLFDYIPSKPGYVFMGWARSSTATVAEFTEGGTNTFTIGSDDVTLYAVWRVENATMVYVEAPTTPVILNQTFEAYIVVSDSDPIKSIAFVPGYDQSIFELVSIEWLRSADLQLVTPEIASAWSVAQDVNGRLIKLVFKATALTAGSEITTTALVQNNGLESLPVTGAIVEVIECPHTNCTISDLDAAKHMYTCTLCGHTYAEAHNFDNSCDTECNTCGHVRQITHTPGATWECDDNEHWHICSVCNARTDVHTHVYDDAMDHICNDCGYSRVMRGDVDGDNDVDSDDAIRVLLHTYFATMYSLNQNGDFDGNGTVDSDDAIYLLLYTYFPSMYPLA